MNPLQVRLVLASIFICGASLRSEEPEIPAIALERALELGAEGIAAKLGDESESGLDAGALYYAAAKRLQTEQALAAKNLLLVIDLDNLRRAVSEWTDAWYDGMYYVSGGGTMWGHLQARSRADLEDVMAAFAKRLPLKPGNATPETLTRWGKLENAIEKAKVPEDADPEMKAMWTAHQKVMLEKWKRLYFEFQAIDEADVQLLLNHLMPSPEELKEFGGE